VEPLIAGLNDPDRLIRAAAADGLGALGDPQAVGPLIDCLNGHTEINSIHIVQALGKLGDARAVEPEITCLTDPKADVRAAAAVALGLLADARAVEPLIASLTDPDQSVRAAAAVALGLLGDARAVEPLFVCIKDKEIVVRGAAAEALGNLADKRAISRLLEALPDWDAKTQLGTALQKLGWDPYSEREQVYYWICKANGANLRSDWGKTQRVLLEDLESGDPRKMENAVNAFVALGNPDMIPILIDILKTQGSKEMAQAYLNSGEGPLAHAARAAASAHGYKLSTDPVPYQPSWRQW
jgi:HEAT repeat protein